MKFNGGRSRDEILAEVESVRSDMDSTLSAIERKLTPGQLVDQGLDYLRSSGANEYLHSLGNSVKQNPVPLALVGVCLGWMMMSGRNNGGASHGAGMQSAGSRLRRATDDAWSGARERARQARTTLSDAAQTARERFDQTRQSVSSTAQSARERFDDARQSVSSAVSSTAQTARAALSRSADVAQRQFERARGGYEWMLREQPLALGAIGVAIGALLAAAAPRTEAEDEWMGEASDRLAERAKEAGREQMERAGDALRTAGASTGADGEKPHGEKMQSAVQEASGTSTSAQQRAETKPGWPGGVPPSE